MKKILKSVCVLIALLIAASALFGCEVPAQGKSKFIASDMLQADGEKVVNGRGEQVALRGVNAGGLGVVEFWMNGFERSNGDDDIYCRDYFTLTQEFIARFGKEKAKQLWERYRQCWWTEDDFKNCADMGMTVIRLPFTYMNVDFDAIENLENAGKSYDFTVLDNFIAGAAKYGMYVILDLHGAYGSQNGKDHSGQVKSAEEVDFYSNEQLQELTIKLWKAVAQRYVNQPAVAGYDILNEPAETTGSGTLTTEKRHWDVFDKIYKAIREVDQNHIVIFESCWGGANLPQPSQYGWENCMYSFHHYTGYSAAEGQLEQHVRSMNERIADVASRNFGVPIYMGEFTCYNNPEQWQYTLNMFNAVGWHWTSWTYKINSEYGAWGVYRVTGGEKVNAHEDGYEEIMQKFQNLVTTEKSKHTFADGTTLFDVIKTCCLLPFAEGLDDGDYTAYADEKPVNVTAENLLTTANDAATLKIAHNADGGSVTISRNSLNLAVSDGGALFASGNNDASKFFLVSVDGGFALLSKSNGKFLRFDDETNRFTCDASDVTQASKFTFEK